MNKKHFILGLAFLLVLGLAISASAQTQTPTICCEKTKSNLYCQDVPTDQCSTETNPATGNPYRQAQTSCRVTSYCRPGICYDSSEGTCLDNTPQLVCNNNKGIWTDKPVPQCNLGCCVLGDQASFVTLTRCKKLSSVLGLETNYKTDIVAEAACIASVYGQEKGACVYPLDLQKTCRFTTREECTGKVGIGLVNKTKGDFYPGKLCSAEELGTVCGPTTQTTCVPGREEVYFVDTCGNPANIYDATKVNDKNYWGVFKDKAESCNPDAANAGSSSCGNCNYILGSYCRKTSVGTAKATYGDNICADMNCHNTQNGKTYKHGESWCVYRDGGSIDAGNLPAGSGFFKHICINGEEVLEACADFRQNVCIEDSISTAAGGFSQAACRVNRWQDCIAQSDEDDCGNTDKRDCYWIGEDDYMPLVDEAEGVCLPLNPPGLKFWDGGDECASANEECEATVKEDLFGGQEEWDGDCVDNQGDLDKTWFKNMIVRCHGMGDCGPKLSWTGTVGEEGYELTKDGDERDPTKGKLEEFATLLIKTAEKDS